MSACSCRSPLVVSGCIFATIDPSKKIIPDPALEPLLEGAETIEGGR
jgi:hypothetical protein